MKHLSQIYCHRILNLACGGVTKETFCMVHHHDLYSHLKRDSIVRSLAEIISPVVRSQGSVMKTPMSVITCQDQSVLVATD